MNKRNFYANFALKFSDKLILKHFKRKYEKLCNKYDNQSSH